MAMAYVVNENGRQVECKADYREPKADNSNNVAEYLACLEAVRWVKTNAHDDEVRVFGDSALIIHQLNGKYQMRSPKLAPIMARINAIVFQEKLKVSFCWIPRYENSVADSLCREELLKHGVKLVAGPSPYRREYMIEEAKRRWQRRVT